MCVFFNPFDIVLANDFLSERQILHSFSEILFLAYHLAVFLPLILYESDAPEDVIHADKIPNSIKQALTS